MLLINDINDFQQVLLIFSISRSDSIYILSIVIEVSPGPEMHGPIGTVLLMIKRKHGDMTSTRPKEEAFHPIFNII